MTSYSPDNAPIIEDEGPSVHELRDYTERELEDLSDVVGKVESSIDYLNRFSPQLVIATIGASDAWYPFSNPRTSAFQRQLADERIRNVPVASATSFSGAMTGTLFGGKSAADYVVQTVAPSICICSFGVNDAYTDKLTAAQITANADALFTKLKAAGITTIFGQIFVHDRVNFVGDTVATKQHGVIPFLGGASQNPLDAGYATSDAIDLNVPLAAAWQDPLNEYRQACTAISALSSVDHTLYYDAFRMARMGFSSADRFHLSEYGTMLMASQELVFFLYDTAIREQYPVLKELIRAPGFEDVGDLFNSALVASGDAWVENNAGNWFAGTQSNEYPHFISTYTGHTGLGIPAMGSWANHQRAQLIVPHNVVAANNSYFEISATGLYPNLPVYMKFWRQAGAEPAWTAAPNTSGKSGVFSTQVAAGVLNIGSWYLKLRVGPDVLGRASIVIV